MARAGVVIAAAVDQLAQMPERDPVQARLVIRGVFEPARNGGSLPADRRLARAEKELVGVLISHTIVEENPGFLLACDGEVRECTGNR